MIYAKIFGDCAIAEAQLDAIECVTASRGDLGRVDRGTDRFGTPRARLILMDTWMKAEKAKLTTDEHCIDDKGAARKLRHPSRSRKLKAFMDGIREA